ncbi:unnamed protein product [Paramecium sonneborni]|uniref:Uncharacterized protein n=1 Tax=Paramecium sonneborni TaxID=65129 RepID=A0A8S1RLK6_9CILI|nr:unnamed protein product [Paramecium sonneborni]
MQIIKKIDDIKDKRIQKVSTKYNKQNISIFQVNTDRITKRQTYGKPFGKEELKKMFVDNLVDIKLYFLSRLYSNNCKKIGQWNEIIKNYQSNAQNTLMAREKDFGNIFNEKKKLVEENIINKIRKMANELSQVMNFGIDLKQLIMVNIKMEKSWFLVYLLD